MFDVHTTAVELESELADLNPTTRVSDMRGEPVAWVTCAARSLRVTARVDAAELRVVATLDYGPGEGAGFLSSRCYRTVRGAARALRTQIEDEQARERQP